MVIVRAYPHARRALRTAPRVSLRIAALPARSRVLGSLLKTDHTPVHGSRPQGKGRRIAGQIDRFPLDRTAPAAADWRISSPRLGSGAAARLSPSISAKAWIGSGR